MLKCDGSGSLQLLHPEIGAIQPVADAYCQFAGIRLIVTDRVPLRRLKEFVEALHRSL